MTRMDAIMQAEEMRIAAIWRQSEAAEQAVETKYAAMLDAELAAIRKEREQMLFNSLEVTNNQLDAII